MGLALDVRFTRKLGLAERFRLAASIIIKGHGQYFDRSCRITKGVGPVQDTGETLSEVAQQAYDEAVDTVTSTSIPP